MNRNQTIWASLDEIRIGERTVSRLSASTVELYRQWLEQGREAPPVRLGRQGDTFVVRDGRHRVAAARAAGHTVIEAEVRPRARLRHWSRVVATGLRRLIGEPHSRARAVVSRRSGSEHALLLPPWPSDRRGRR